MGALAAQNVVNALIIEMFSLFEVAVVLRVVLSEDLSDFFTYLPHDVVDSGYSRF